LRGFYAAINVSSECAVRIIFNFISSLNDIREKSTNETKKQEAETKYEYSQIRSFSSSLAEPETAPRITSVHELCQKTSVYDTQINEEQT